MVVETRLARLLAGLPRRGRPPTSTRWWRSCSASPSSSPAGPRMAPWTSTRCEWARRVRSSSTPPTSPRRPDFVTGCQRWCTRSAPPLPATGVAVEGPQGDRRRSPSSATGSLGSPTAARASGLAPAIACWTCSRTRSPTSRPTWPAPPPVWSGSRSTTGCTHDDWERIADDAGRQRAHLRRPVSPTRPRRCDPGSAPTNGRDRRRPGQRRTRSSSRRSRPRP